MRLHVDGLEDGVLDELRFHWGDAYDIVLEDGQCTALRRDGKGGTLADPLPEGLRLRIVADYGADPVSRDLPPPAGVCLRCKIPDPPPEMTCTGGRDHRVGVQAGCPGCGRVPEACAARPCSAARAAGGTGGIPAGAR